MIIEFMLTRFVRINYSMDILGHRYIGGSSGGTDSDGHDNLRDSWSGSGNTNEDMTPKASRQLSE